MSAESDSPIDPRLANLDANATVELCASLADYGEAGGLSRELMLRVGSYAESRYGEDFDVLLAVARMYLLGGEGDRARQTLVRAGQLGDEDRVLPVLSHVLAVLNDPRSPEQVLREGSVEPQPRELESDPTPREEDVRAEPAEPRPRAVVRSEGGETFGRASMRSQVPDAPRPSLRSEPDTVAFAGPSTMPPRTSGGEQVPSTMTSRGSTIDLGPSSQARRITTRMPRKAAAQVLASYVDPTPNNPAEVRTEVSRRALAKEAPENEPRTEPASGPSPGSTVRASRLRLLDPEDERRFLDPYELIAEIASGGMATVYLGRLAGAGGFQRFVAIKRLHPHLASEEQFVQMFLDEARLAAGIHNPHVVPILEVGTSKGGSYYLVMEFIEGDTLSGVTSRALQHGIGLPPHVALRVVVDSLVGLHAAHQLTDADGQLLGLVHRDCTPQNILVGVDGSARITDFGVARAASRLAITRPQQVKGKVAYLSPEQAHAMELDRRSDIFTMGIVLWEALAGRSLFTADTEAATLSRLVSASIPSVRSFARDVPQALDDVCRRALQRDRSRRFRTAAEMAEAIERAATEEGGIRIASPRELGKFVDTVMGVEIAAQREAVRAWLAQNDASPLIRSARPAGASPSQRPPPMTAEEITAAARARATVPDISADDTLESPAPAGERPRVSSRPPPAARTSVPPSAEASPAPPDAEPAAERLRTPPPPTPRRAPPTSPLAGVIAAVKRVARARMSTTQGIVLIVLLVTLATSPLWLRATKQLVRGPRASTTAPRETPSPNEAEPGASPTGDHDTRAAATHTAWDEGAWAVPEAGTRTGAASSATPPEKK